MPVSIAEEYGGMGSLGGCPCEDPHQTSENSLHRRYKTPQMHVSLTLFRDYPISTKKTSQHGV